MEMKVHKVYYHIFFQKALYESGKVMSQMRLLQGQTVLEDDRKLSDYSLPEGAVISALFEPDVDIDIEVCTGSQINQFTVSHAMSVMGLKGHICGLVRSAMSPHMLDIRLGEVSLDDSMPLHFYGITNNTRLDALKPDVGVTIDNNHGEKLYWRLYRKNTIRETKEKLATVQTVFTEVSTQSKSRKVDLSQRGANMSALISGTISSTEEIRECQDGGRMSAEAMRFYLMTEEENSGDGWNYSELHDDETVDTYNIKDGDVLYLLSYRWNVVGHVTISKSRRILLGVEPDDTCLGIKLRAQDQLGIPVDDLRVVDVSSGRMQVQSDYVKPLVKTGATLQVWTEEELQAEHARKDDERKANQALRLEREKARQAGLAERRRAKLEETAAKAGLTVEEYEAEQIRKQEEARLERDRQIQARREEQTRRMGRQGFRRF